MRKQQKQLSRRKAQHARRVKSEYKRLQLKKLNTRPTFVVDSQNADPKFVELIMSACEKVDFKNPQQFSQIERTAYRLLGTSGLRAAVDFLDDAKAADPENAFAIDRKMIFNLGQQVFDIAGEDKVRQFLPYNDATFVISHRKIVALFRSLDCHKGSRGKIYSSFAKPKLTINGWGLTIGFSRHAIDRICDRINPSWANYSASGDIFALFSQCRHYEYLELPDGSPAFRVLDQCFEGYRNYQYVERVLGVDRLPMGTHGYFLLGYCPAVPDKSGYFVAKTFLPPGFKNTPENLLIRQIRDPKVKRRALDFAETLSMNYMHYPDGLDIVKWYHDLGVPQVTLGNNYFKPL